MFCNTSELLDRKTQIRIKEYSFCKAFSCPPYPTLQETPAEIIDDFLKIERNMNRIKKESHANK
tara:strand:+ start:801 stop:992 length:192 start_codon:yes stop_codon:yes gene_type:complete